MRVSQLLFLTLLISIVLVTCTSRLLEYQNRPLNAPQSFDCAARKLAYQYALKLQPWRGQLKTVFDALELSTLCGVTFPGPSDVKPEAPSYKIPAVGSLYVDADKGSDSNPGTLNLPFRSIQHAIDAARPLGGATIVLRAGTFYLSAPISLGSKDDNIVLTNYPGEFVTVSGGIPLKTVWKPYNITAPQFQVFYGSNNVYGRAISKGDTATIKYLGLMNTTQECETACKNYAINGNKCYSFTFHTPQLADATWRNQCFGVIDTTWSPVAEANINSGFLEQKNIWVADLSGQGVREITGLQLNGVRAIRARYPNANPETALFPAGWILSQKGFLPPKQYPPAVTYTINSPMRTDIIQFQKYTIGRNGTCVVYTPPESYWCSADSSGGGAFTYRVPSGVIYNPDTFEGRVWKNPIGAVVHMWRPAHWSMWMFEIGGYNPDTQTISFSKGGFQGARGSNTGGEWYVDGIFEELDSPSEFYYDTVDSKLYFFYNGTGAPPADSLFVATNLPILISAVGTQQDPVKNLVIQGIKFTATRYTYMDPHGVPSGGDWGLQRSAALFFEGTEGLTVDGNLFERLDGNALMLSGYNREATISKNEFVWIGDSAIAGWGYTQEIDGTNGEQPRRTLITGNLVHEIGHFQKQSSAWFQAKSCQTRITQNIIFNGPRAGINFNDGFGGANEVDNNLLFNECRESSDHGPFNSWDREPFLTEVATGKPSLTPAYNEIHNNFFICNYGSSMCVDNDDGSSYYKIYQNFEVYGGHKSDFGGHNKFTYSSVVAYSQDYEEGLCGNFNGAVPHYVDGYYNNTCVQSRNVPYLDITSSDPTHPDPAVLPLLGNNVIYNPTGQLTVRVGSKIFKEEEWQALGFDRGTVCKVIPSDEEIINMGRRVIGF